MGLNAPIFLLTGMFLIWSGKNLAETFLREDSLFKVFIEEGNLFRFGICFRIKH